MRRLVAALAAGAALLVPAAVSRADENIDPRVQIVVTDVTPGDGVTVTVAQPVIAHLAPLFTLRNRSGKTIVLFGEDGVPFLRSSTDAVEGNVRSSFFGGAVRPNDPPPPSPGGPAPLWQPHATGDVARWYDRRASYAGHGPDDREKPATLGLVTIDGTIDGEAFAIRVEIRWRPVLGRVEPALRTISPNVEGVAVRLVAGPIPAVELRNASPRVIQITGRDGRPFARIGPDGVEVNENSPTYRDTRSQPEAPTTEESWRPQGGTVLIWLEKRAAVEDPPASVQASGRMTTLLQWTIPGRIDDAPFAIQGTTNWVPSKAAREAPGPEPAPAGGGFPWWIPVAAVVLAGGAAAAFMLRRRTRA